MCCCGVQLKGRGDVRCECGVGFHIEEASCSQL
jgi:hypothetical protein